jgi:hypothetical protein
MQQHSLATVHLTSLWPLVGITLSSPPLLPSIHPRSQTQTLPPDLPPHLSEVMHHPPPRQAKKKKKKEKKKKEKKKKKKEKQMHHAARHFRRLATSSHAAWCTTLCG